MKTIVEHKKALLGIETLLELETYVEDNMSINDYSLPAIKEVTAFRNRLLKKYNAKPKPKKKVKDSHNQQNIY